MTRLHGFLLFSSFLLLTIEGRSQRKIEPGSLEDLSWKVFFAAEKYDVVTPVRRTEFILVFLEVDSNGYVSGIHLMDDEENRDSTYAALSKITHNDLKDWSNKKYRNKVLMLPVESYREYNGDKGKTYLEKQGLDFLPKVFTNNTGSDYILLDRFYFAWRGSKFTD